MPELAVVVVELWALVELMVAAAVLENVHEASTSRWYARHNRSAFRLLYHQKDRRGNEQARDGWLLSQRVLPPGHRSEC